MTVWNLGSINTDHIFYVDRLPERGETISARSYMKTLGGKGANISVALARAGSHVRHIGAVGVEGKWASDLLLELGVDTRDIQVVSGATSQANIFVEASGENAIILGEGASQHLDFKQCLRALEGSQRGDWFVCQNETNLQSQVASTAKEKGLRVAYIAAPFDEAAVRDVMPFVDLLILNEVEARQLEAKLQISLNDCDVESVVVTMGERGSKWIFEGKETLIPAIPADAVDTTGAGDTFAGYVLAGLDRGQPMLQALKNANLAASIMVSRFGTAEAIPDLKDIEDYRSQQ